MSPLVTGWLHCQGYVVYSEVDVTGKIDHVGVRWSDRSIICVEMKTSCTRKLLNQAMIRQLITPAVYVVVPQLPRPKSVALIKQYGLGLLVRGRVEFAPGEPQVAVHPHYRERLLCICERTCAGGVGGLPTLLGDGPAIRVRQAVRKFREENPGATWKQVYESVPNHYASARSMQGAMRQVQIAEQWRARKQTKESTQP